MPDSAADLLARLVAIPSVNPDLAPGADGEAATASVSISNHSLLIAISFRRLAVPA